MLRYCSSRKVRDDSAQHGPAICGGKFHPLSRVKQTRDSAAARSFLTLSQPASELDTRGTRRGPPLCDP